MAGYRLTAEADVDLSEIYEYSIENFGLAKAQDYLLGILGASRFCPTTAAWGEI